MKSVLVPLAQGSEDLEAVTVLNILRRAGIEAVSASLDGHPIRGYSGLAALYRRGARRHADRRQIRGGHTRGRIG